MSVLGFLKTAYGLIGNTIVFGFSIANRFLHKLTEYKALMVLVVVAIVKWFYAVMINSLNLLLAKIEEMKVIIDGLEVSSSWQADFVSWLSFGNNFFPIEELFAISAALLLLFVVGTLYRTLKSLIPSMS